MFDAFSHGPWRALPLVLLVAACGGGGGGTSGSSSTGSAGALPAFSDRAAFANAVIDAQVAVVNAGRAAPTDLPASASYAGQWAMSLDPAGSTEIVGGPVTLDADFAGGRLGGTMVQEILPGAAGTLSIANGRIVDSDLSGNLRGSLQDPDGSGVIGIDTTLGGFVSATGAQGTMTGSATRNGARVGAEGAFAASR